MGLTRIKGHIARVSGGTHTGLVSFQDQPHTSGHLVIRMALHKDTKGLFYRSHGNQLSKSAKLLGST